MPPTADSFDHPTTRKTGACRGPREKPGAQGRIRTSVARKERQIYSLLPLTTRPPVHASTEHPALGSFPTANPESPILLSKNISPSPSLTIPAKLRNWRVPILPPAIANSGGCCWNQFFSRRAASGLACSCYASAARSWPQFWSWRRDLNPRPSDYKSDALPAELRQPAARFDTYKPTQARLVLPAGTIIKVITSGTQGANRSPACKCQFTYYGGPTTRHSRGPHGWDSAERVRYRER
jgi:hypothetical protein